MKKSVLFLTLFAFLAVSSCAVNSLGAGVSGGTGDADDFTIANQIVKGSLQVVGQGTNDLDKGLNPYLTFKGGLNKDLFDFYSYCEKSYSFNFSLWLGTGSVDANLQLSNHTQLRIPVPFDVTNTNFIHSFVIGGVVFHDFRIGKMAEKANGSLLASLSAINDVAGGTLNRSVIFNGDITNGSRILQVHFESYTVQVGTNSVSYYSNCFVNGYHWTPSI